MAIPQQKFREIVFQLLYSYDLAETSDEDMLPFLMHEFKVTRKTLLEAQTKKSLIQEKLENLDRLIATTAIDYDFHRISRIEKNVLRLALFEMLHDESVPGKVAIAEAIRLVRKFSSPEGASFVNAILDKHLTQ